MNKTPQTLYVIVARGQIGNKTETSLAEAAKRAGLQYELLILDDVALDDAAAMRFDAGSLLYSASIKPHALSLESALATLHADRLTTIYRPKLAVAPTRQYAEMIEQIAAGLPIIPSHIVDKTWLANGEAELLAKVKTLGGFPVLYKTLGLSHGQGVFKVDTLEELRDLVAQTNASLQQAIVREYLPEYRHYRLIVVDNAVVAVIEYHKPANDFRTNATSVPKVTPVALENVDTTIADVAIASVRLASSILGGVDVLFDTTKNRAYLAEVNIHCNFSRAEGPTGVDISGQIIAALIRKAEVTS